MLERDSAKEGRREVTEKRGKVTNGMAVKRMKMKRLSKKERDNE